MISFSLMTSLNRFLCTVFPLFICWITKVTAAIKFFMPQPAFIIGFDEFDENNPSGMIDKFINCKSMFKA